MIGILRSFVLFSSVFFLFKWIGVGRLFSGRTQKCCYLIKEEDTYSSTVVTKTESHEWWMISISFTHKV